MIRTQLYLPDNVYNTLKAVKARQRKTISVLVREALQKVYGTSDAAKRLGIMESAFGVWKKRADLGTTERFVRSLRKDRRRKRITSERRPS